MTVAELKSDTRFLTQSDSTSYGDTDILRSLNEWYKRAVNWIWDATGQWQYDDTNASDLPVATANLVSEQAQYTLPSTAQRLYVVEILDANGTWKELKLIDKSQMGEAPSQFEKTPGLPVYYDVLANVITLYPAPKTGYVTLSSGLRIHVSREVTALSGDTDVPGFESNYHRILSLGAAIDYCTAFEQPSREVSLRKKLFGDVNDKGLKRELEEYISAKTGDSRSYISPKIYQYK